MKKKIYNLLFTLPLLFGAVSCLEKIPGDYVHTDDGMQTLTDAEETVNGIYTGLLSGALYSGYLVLCPDIQADLVYAVQGNSNTYGNIWQWDILSTNSEVGSVYAGLYSVIGCCNYYLDKVEALKASLIDDDQIASLDALTGEVHCARALCYSELVKCFCKAYDPATAANELGVVLRTKYYEEEPAVRASLKDSYEFIISELDAAVSLLDEEYSTYNAVYFNNAAAHALRARVALNMQDWDKAIEESSFVIDSGIFTLASVKTKYSSTQTMLDFMWTGDASYEIIMKLGYTSTSYGSAQGSVFLNFNRDYTYYYPDFVPAAAVINSYDSSDGRYNAYFAELQTGYSHALKWPLLVKYYGNSSLLQQNIFHVNMPKILRLAEQYLIRAEAYCRKGQYSKASADLTTLRQSRYTSGGVASVNEENWLDFISAERVRELFMEGFRLNDLKRWNRGFERTPQTSCQPEGSSLKVSSSDPLFVWPIPRNEIEAPGSEILPNESNR